VNFGRFIGEKNCAQIIVQYFSEKKSANTSETMPLK
jgi:hypothetical protein